MRFIQAQTAPFLYHFFLVIMMLRKCELNETLATWTEKFGRIEDRDSPLTTASFDLSSGKSTPHHLEVLLKRMKGEAKKMQVREREAIRKLREELSLPSIHPDRIAEARARYGPTTLTYTLHRLGAILWDGGLGRNIPLEEMEEVIR